MFLSFQGFPGVRVQIQLQSLSGDARSHTHTHQLRMQERPTSRVAIAPTLCLVALFTFTTRSSAALLAPSPSSYLDEASSTFTVYTCRSAFFWEQHPSSRIHFWTSLYCLC